MRPDARPQARKNRRRIRWNTLRIFSGRERRRWSQIVRRSRTVTVGQAPRFSPRDRAAHCAQYQASQYEPDTSQVCLVHLVCFVCLVDLVHLVRLVHRVSLVQPNKQDKPNKQNKRDRRDGLIWFIWSVWFIWFVLFIWLVSFNQKTRQTR